MATPLHRDPMTIEEYDALPDDGLVRHELPQGWECALDFEVIVRAEFPPILRAPDLVVVRADSPQNRASAADVRLAVEIVSPGTRNVDLHLKAFEYADAGIPHYWVVDLDPPAPSITVFGLGAPGDGYRESQTATGELVVAEPFPLRIDITALLRRGR